MAWMLRPRHIPRGLGLLILPADGIVEQSMDGSLLSVTLPLEWMKIYKKHF